MARELFYTEPSLLDQPKRGWLFGVLFHNGSGPDAITELTMLVETEEGNLLHLTTDAVRFVSGEDHEYARAWQCLANCSVLTDLESRSEV